MYKRIPPLLLALALVVPVAVVMPVPVRAAETVASGSCGTSVNWTLTDDGTLRIAGTGAMANYRSGTMPWYYYESVITNVIIDSGVTTVGEYAFYDFDNIVSVVMADSVTALGTRCFYSCGSLASVVFSASLKYIWSYSFCSCVKLTSVTFPETLSYIGTNAFQLCNSLVTVILPSSVKSTLDYCFANCSSLMYVTSYAQTPPTCGTTIFDSCSKLTWISVPYGFSDEYKAASGWSTYAGFITENEYVYVSTPNVQTSFDGQVIYLQADETAKFFLLVDNVNGTLSIDWAGYYLEGGAAGTGGKLYSGDGFVLTEDGQYIGAWEFTPDTDLIPFCIALKARITNTIGDYSESVDTDIVIVHVGCDHTGDNSGGSDDDTDVTIPSTGSSDNSETMGKLEEIETSLDEVKDAVASVEDKLDGVSDQLDGLGDKVDEILSGGQAGEDLVNKGDQLGGVSSDLSEDIGSIEDFENLYLGQLDAGMGDILSAGDLTVLAAPLGFVQKYLDMIVAAIPGSYMVVFTLPIFLGIFFYIVQHSVKAPRPDTSGDEVTRETFTETTILSGPRAGQTTSTRTVTTSQEIGRVHKE